MASYSSGVQLDVNSISLSPSEIRDAILNDGTQFAGADIDTQISNAQPILEKYPNIDYVKTGIGTQGNQTSTLATGEGVFNLARLSVDNDRFSTSCKVIADGTTVISYGNNTTIEINGIGYIKFDNKIEINANGYNGDGTNRTARINVAGLLYMA